MHFICRERGREGEREREKHRLVDWGPGLRSQQESNWQPFGLWDNAQSTKPQQSGLGGVFF